MNAPLTRPDARPELSRKWGPWAYVLRYWNVIRPGWPAPAFALLTCTMLWASSQGREALYAVSDWSDKATFLTTYGVVIATSIVQYGVFLWAVCGYYKSFSDRAMQGVDVRLLSATIVGMITPTFLVLFYLVSSSARVPVANASVDDVLIMQAPLIASLVVWGVLLTFGVWRRRRWVHLNLSPFSAIARVRARFRTTILVLIGAGVLTAMVTQFWPSSARLFGPVGLTLLGMTLWAVAWTRAAAFVEKHGWPPTPALAICLAIVFSLVGPWVDGGLRALGAGRADIISFDRNRVDLIEDTSRAAPADVDEHAARWLNERRNRSPGEPVRAIVVLAEGGGIRAAVQTAALLGALDSQDQNFFDDLYVVSGVSGGSVGISTYLAAKSEGLEDIQEAAVAPLRQDHLSPVLATMYFWDWLLAFVPAPTAGFGGWLDYDLHDRGSAFEASLQQAQSGMGASGQPCQAGHGMRRRLWQDNAMACPFLDVVNQAARRERLAAAPIVLLNTTRTLDGDNEVVSNVVFNSADRLCNVLRRTPPDQTLSLATAAHLSARFPFVSPPGAMRVGRNCSAESADQPSIILRYVDGGYLDNSGALSASEAVAALEKAKGDTIVEYIVIHIYTPVLITTDAPTSNEMLPEVTAPLDAVTRARSLQGLGPVINLCRQVEATRTPAPNQRSCDDLARSRTVSGANAEDAVGAGFVQRYVLSGSVRGRTPGAYWITAPLPVSDGRRGTRKQFVPLGWVLGPESTNYVVQGSRHLAITSIAGQLQLSAPAPQRAPLTP